MRHARRACLLGQMSPRLPRRYLSILKPWTDKRQQAEEPLRRRPASGPARVPVSSRRCAIQLRAACAMGVPPGCCASRRPSRRSPPKLLSHGLPNGSRPARQRLAPPRRAPSAVRAANRFNFARDISAWEALGCTLPRVAQSKRNARRCRPVANILDPSSRVAAGMNVKERVTRRSVGGGVHPTIDVK